MPIITLDFNYEINDSIQVGDIAYYSRTTPVGSPGTSGNWASTTTPHLTDTRENIIMIGPIIAKTSTSIQCDMPMDLAAQYGAPKLAGTGPGLAEHADFIMFSKDNKANLSSLLGYYSLVKIRNNSKTEAEMFNISADFTESSK